MGEYTATVRWIRNAERFTDNRYHRGHEWSFDGGAKVPGSSSPLSVPLPLSDPQAVDPEEALVAALSSCHMLWFLSIAAKAGFVVDEYKDAAVGAMGKDDRGKRLISRVALRPTISFSGAKLPSAEEIAALHHRAHEECELANSVKAEIVIEPAARVES